MKINAVSALVAVLALCVGCASWQQKGPAYGREQQFREQIEKSVPVTDWRYKVQDVKFSKDYYKAWVVFMTPGGIQKEVVIEYNCFQQYTGRVLDNDGQITAKSFDPAPGRAFITVTLPDR